MLSSYFERTSNSVLKITSLPKWPLPFCSSRFVDFLIVSNSEILCRMKLRSYECLHLFRRLSSMRRN